jgi:hypothetical protein
MPGWPNWLPRCRILSYSPYTSADGEHVAIIEFESHETVRRVAGAS